MRILSVQLRWLYDDEQIVKRRETLSNLGFDTSKIDEEQIKALSLGCTDAQFVELTIAGEQDMRVITSVTTDEF
jgi:hypothetical protein